MIPAVSLNTNPDVLIIGSGAAGMAAMVAASRAGATVTLLEKNGYAGGKATAAYVGTVCGLWYRSDEHQPLWVHKGFPQEFAERLQQVDGIEPCRQKDGLFYLPYEHSTFISVCDSLIREHTKSVCFHSTVTHMEPGGPGIGIVEAVCGGELIRFQPSNVIDASGEAVFAKTLGMARIASDSYQAAALVFGFSGMDDDSNGSGTLSLLKVLKQGISTGTLPVTCEKVSVVPGSWRNGRLYLKLAVPVEVTNRPDRRTDIEFSARDSAMKISTFLKAHHELFRKSSMCFLAPETGIRTGPRYLGRQILTENQVLGCVKHEKAIARGAWPVEHWDPGKYADMTYFPERDHYDITSGMLRSPKFENFFFAGRNMSADDRAIASARVISTCLATGYAAGVLAAGHAMGATEFASISKARQELGID